MKTLTDSPMIWSRAKTAAEEAEQRRAFLVRMIRRAVVILFLSAVAYAWAFILHYLS